MRFDQINIKREMTAENINLILNHHSVRPFVAEGIKPIDLTPQLSNKENILLMGEHGGCFLSYILPGIYEVHTQILPEGRGQWARNFIASVAHWLFVGTSAIEVLTRVPEPHKGAKMLALHMGMTRDFALEDKVHFNGEMVQADIYSYRIQDWVKTAPFVISHGEWFHLRLKEETKRLNIEIPLHEPDETHNRYVGASLEMARTGQYEKCVAFYNRWAFLARDHLISLVSREPPIIKMDLGYLEFEGDNIRLSHGRNS